MSARSLPLRQMQKNVKESRRGKEPEDPQALGPDEMRLYSYYRPGLVAGDYEINATQSINSPSAWGPQNLVVENAKVVQDKTERAFQDFEVVVPRFSLDPDLINSYYPPDGHQDEGRILPHIVLNDPHYPWEIQAGIAPNLREPIDPYDAYDEHKNPVKLMRGLVPWIALIVFDPEELHFTSIEQLQALKLEGFQKPEDVNKQDVKGIFTMKVKDYLDSNKLPQSSRINYAAGFPSHQANDDTDTYGMMLKDESNVDVIFPPKTLFEQLFASKQDKSKSAVENYRYLSHVRHINTIGFPDAGVEEEGLFSIVISGRLGRFDIQQPQTQICHLVSIENVDSTLGNWLHPDGAPSDRVGMISLHSWIYTSLPPNPVNFVDTVRNLVLNQQMLRVDQHVLDSLDTKNAKVKIMSERLKQGYTLARWRTQSGEETAAFNRGPLVPGKVPWPVSEDIVDCSNTSQDLQILDPQTGLMDLTYSSAWQLGKLLAISDTSFSSALMRFRSLVHNSSVHQTQSDISPMISATASIKSLVSVMSTIKSLAKGHETGEPDRFRPPTLRAPAPILQDPSVQPLLNANLGNAISLNASAGVKEDSDGKRVGTEIYNEFNLDQGNNSDWAIIHAWICEKLCLGGIPPQYLLPESAFLPPESLRFFHIDDFWLDSFLDGALSVANHLDSDDDRTRRDIKKTFNKYLGDEVRGAGYKPQIPCYGFIIRSKLIKTMPDLRITLKWKNVIDPVTGKPIEDKRAPVCRWTKWDAETLMCLLDRQPEELLTSQVGAIEEGGITLAQPPHQQRFSLGSYVRKGNSDSKTANLVEFDLRRLYTTPAHPVEWPEKPMKDKSITNTWLDFDTRIIDSAKMAKDMNDALQFAPPDGKPDDPAYTDTCPNSSAVALELNDPSYYFRILPPRSDYQPVPANQRQRQLYVKSDAQISADEALKRFREDLAAAERTTPVPGPPAPSPTPQPPPVNPTPPPTPTPTPTPSQRPAQNQTRIQPVPASRLIDYWKPGGRLTTTQCFNLRAIYPDYKTLPDRYPGDKWSPADYVPSANRYFFDLIFIIQRTKSLLDQQLIRVDIDIPMRFPSHDDRDKRDPRKPRPEALVQDTYYGPGIRMLSNQYFVPYLYYWEPVLPNTNGVMHIELIPRAAKTDFTLPVNDRRTLDLSFRLAEANISPREVLSIVNIDDGSHKLTTDSTKAKVLVTMTEWYKAPGGPGMEPAPQFGQKYGVLKTGPGVVDDADW